MSERTLFPIPQPYPQSNGKAAPVATALKDLAARIRQAHETGLALLCNALERFWTVGQLLEEAKRQVALGKWEKWVAENCPFALRTAQKYMKVFLDFPNREDLEAHDRAPRAISVIGKELAEAAQPEPPEPPPPTPQQEEKARNYVNENAIESICDLMAAKRVSPTDALKLTRLTEPEQQAAAIHIQANGTVCATAQVETLIKDITGSRQTAPVEDCLGTEVPLKLRDVFADTTALDFIKNLQSFFRCIKKDRARFYFFHRKEVFKACGDLEALVEESLPHSLCSCCKGKGRARGESCRRCLGQGYISRGIYQDEVPEPSWEGAK